MWATTVFKVCILAWFVQGRTCLTIADVENQLLPAIQAIQSDISSILGSGPALITSVQNNVTSLINSATTNFQNTVKSLTSGLNSDLTTTAAKAVAAGLDISSCTKAATTALNNLDTTTDVITGCNPNINFATLGNQVADFSSTLADVSGAFASCLAKYPLNVTAFGNCLQAIITSAQADVSSVQDQLSSLGGIPAQVSTCLNSATSGVTSDISTIQKTFDKCAQAIINAATDIVKPLNIFQIIINVVLGIFGAIFAFNLF